MDILKRAPSLLQLLILPFFLWLFPSFLLILLIYVFLYHNYVLKLVKPWRLRNLPRIFLLHVSYIPFTILYHLSLTNPCTVQHMPSLNFPITCSHSAVNQRPALQQAISHKILKIPVQEISSYLQRQLVQWAGLNELLIERCTWFDVFKYRVVGTKCTVPKALLSVIHI